MLLTRNVGHLHPRIFGKVWQNQIVSDAALNIQIRAARRAPGDLLSARKPLSAAFSSVKPFATAMWPCMGKGIVPSSDIS